MKKIFLVSSPLKNYGKKNIHILLFTDDLNFFYVLYLFNLLFIIGPFFSFLFFFFFAYLFVLEWHVKAVNAS